VRFEDRSISLTGTIVRRKREKRFQEVVRSNKVILLEDVISLELCAELVGKSQLVDSHECTNI
jgi:hypothetical protein